TRQSPKMPSSQSIAPVMPRGPYYNFVDVIGSFNLLRCAQLRASRSGIRALFFLARVHRFGRNNRQVVIGIAPRLRPFRSVEPFLAMIAKEIFHYPVLQRMESDHADPSAPLESRNEDAQALLQGSQLIVPFHPQRLKHLSSRMLSSVTAYELFNRARELERFVKGRSFAYFHDHARNEARSRFFAELTKDAGQFLFAVIVYNCRRCEARMRVHPHVERTVSHQTEAALRVFELSGRNTQ